MRLSYIHTYIQYTRHLTGKEKDKLQRRKVVVAKFGKVLKAATASSVTAFSIMVLIKNYLFFFL